MGFYVNKLPFLMVYKHKTVSLSAILSWHNT